MACNEAGSCRSTALDLIDKYARQAAGKTNEGLVRIRELLRVGIEARYGVSSAPEAPANADFPDGGPFDVPEEEFHRLPTASPKRIALF